MTDIQNLKRLAEAASPGPWQLHHEAGQKYGETLTGGQHYDADYFAVAAQNENDGNVECICDNGQYYACDVSENNIRFIASANPSTILALIQRIEESEKILPILAYQLRAAGACLPLENNGTIESAMNGGLGIALMLVENAIAAQSTKEQG